ncbi:MAG: sodium:solute symporter family protein [candidate division Zixibacteria bacterium]|nr:sodium:solute symporter family protein [candidate division Zixibacteria bacterium]MBU1470049.1 sodium:solute symporter family protein [candidate division Zixibacteria bacterium]MBU2624369.1 sodium:solute symporter family protein [candidate division Zixibacteria bacterium]
MNWIPLSIVCSYIVLLFAITWLTRHLSRGGMIAYLLAGRNLPSWVIAPLLTGLAVGGASTIGVAERAYSSGISAGWYNAAWAAGALLVGLFAAHRYRRLEVSTLPELFERHYNVSGRVIGVIGQLVLQVVITSLQYVAGGAILSSLLPEVFSFQTGMLVTAIVFVGTTLIGGFWAAGITNIINVTFIYAGVVLGAIMAVGKVGGIGDIVSKLPPQHPGFDLGAIGWGLIIAWFVVMCTTVFSVQSIVQISFAAKDGQSARKGFIMGGLIILPIGFVSALIGVAAAVLHPGIVPTEALPRMVLSLSPFVAGVILAGLWAADVSTASALLIGSATLVVGDLVKRFVAPGLDEKGERVVSRISVLALSVVTYILAVSVSGILKTLLIGLTLTTAYTLLTLMTIFWPQVCRRSHAVWTLLMAMGALTVWLTFPQVPSFFKEAGLAHPIFLCWIVSLVTFLVVAVVDKRRILVRN